MKKLSGYTTTALFMLSLVAAPVFAQDSGSGGGGGGLGSTRSQDTGAGYSEGLGRANAPLGGQQNAQTAPAKPKAFMGYDKPLQSYPPEYWRAPDPTMPGWAHSQGGGTFHTEGGTIHMTGSQPRG
jgi:hypothetical protein